MIVGVIIFVIIAVVGTGLYFAKHKMLMDAKNVPAFEPPTAVTIIPARTTQWYPTSDLVGTVIALRSVTVQNEVEGVVRSVGFQSGDIVEAGQVLVTLDDSTMRAELNTEEAALKVAQAEVSVADARLRLAEAELRMQEAAAQSRATAAIEVTRARAELERTTAEQLRSQASVDEAKARIDKIKTQLAKHVIKAPFRARVGLRSVHEGQFLAQQMGSEGTPIATLQEMADKIYIDFPIPQEHLHRVRIGMIVMGQRGGSGTGSTGEPIRLEVAAMDSSVSNATRNVRIRTIVDNTDQSLRPGMFIKIRVPIDEPRPYVVVPNTAIRRDSYANQVFIVQESDKPGPDGKPQLRAKQRFIKLGPTIGEDVIVLEGLKEGEQIASSGSFKLREGALIMPGMPPAPAGAPPVQPADQTPPASAAKP